MGYHELGKGVDGVRSAVDEICAGKVSQRKRD